ncbi:hypothetical protein DM01DRAFT_1369654 [Hesseltinella vesiculosa]|uniref:Uncharacterized protein n=1 Tax=Hesseltinella vesiculosa TaxID=101127 RepID=A0A1X2GZM2_9FUNG|nr:hypothetical protein DM01DRAFT_1369654 [Hesseltinella vesiculosa]
MLTANNACRIPATASASRASSCLSLPSPASPSTFSSALSYSGSVPADENRQLMRRPATVGASKPQNKSSPLVSHSRHRSTKTVATTFACQGGGEAFVWLLCGWLAQQSCAGQECPFLGDCSSALWSKRLFWCLGSALPSSRELSYELNQKDAHEEATLRQEMPERMPKRTQVVHSLGRPASGVSAAGVAPAKRLCGRHAGGRHVAGHREVGHRLCPTSTVTFGPMVRVHGGRTVLLGFPPYHIVPGRFIPLWQTITQQQSLATDTTTAG